MSLCEHMYMRQYAGTTEKKTQISKGILSAISACAQKHVQMVDMVDILAGETDT